MDQSSRAKDPCPSPGTLEPEFFFDWEYERQLQKDYEAGKFDPKGRKPLGKSGLVVLHWVRRVPSWINIAA